MIHAHSHYPSSYPQHPAHKPSPMWLWVLTYVAAVLLLVIAFSTPSGAKLFRSVTRTFSALVLSNDNSTSTDTSPAITLAPDQSLTQDLQAELRNPDPTIRVSGVDALGKSASAAGLAALFSATYDTDARVRAHAVQALGETQAVTAVPRLQQIEVLDSSEAVWTAAFDAEYKIRAHIAGELNLPANEVSTLAIVSSLDETFVATLRDLYLLRQGQWVRVGSLPDQPTALVIANNDEKILFLGTASSGLYRSSDGGQTWEKLAMGLPNETWLMVTALAVDPMSPEHVYVAMTANVGTTHVERFPLGIFASGNGGDQWSPLPNLTLKQVTTRLIFDPEQPSDLFGLTDAGSWHYNFSSRACEKCPS